MIVWNEKQYESLSVPLVSLHLFCLKIPHPVSLITSSNAKQYPYPTLATLLCERISRKLVQCKRPKVQLMAVFAVV